MRTFEAEQVFGPTNDSCCCWTVRCDELRDGPSSGVRTGLAYEIILECVNMSRWSECVCVVCMWTQKVSSILYCELHALELLGTSCVGRHACTLLGQIQVVHVHNSHVRERAIWLWATRKTMIYYHR